MASSPFDGLHVRGYALCLFLVPTNINPNVSEFDAPLFKTCHLHLKSLLSYSIYHLFRSLCVWGMCAYGCHATTHSHSMAKRP